MELLVGESLRNMLERPLSIARAIQIFDDIASALAYAHEEGIVHRGVRPSNIMVLRSGVAKIGDFGIGQIGEAARRYMSPEQVRGGPVDHRSDLFSLGALFYEMLTRRALFEGNSPQEIMENILHAEPPLPSAVNPHVPGALDGIIGSLLAGHPDERVADARILLRDLQRLEEGLGLGPGTGAGSGEPTARLPPGGARGQAAHARCTPIARPRGAARNQLPATRSDGAGGAPTRPRADAGCPSARRARCEVHNGPRTGAETLFWISRGRLGGTRPHARSAWTYRLLVLLAGPQRTTHRRDPYARSAGDSGRCAGGITAARNGRCESGARVIGHRIRAEPVAAEPVAAETAGGGTQPSDPRV